MDFLARCKKKMEVEGEVGEVVVMDVWEDKGDVFCEGKLKHMIK